MKNTQRIKSPFMKLLFISIFVAWISSTFASTKTILVMSAMKSEYQNFIVNLPRTKITHYKGLTIAKTNVNGIRVIASYSGIGALNAAIAATLLINHYHPDIFIVDGVAGSISKKHNIGDIIIGNKIFSELFWNISRKGPSFPFKLIQPIRKETQPLVFHSNKSLITLAKSIKFDKPINVFPIVTDSAVPDQTRIIHLMQEQGVSVVDFEDTAFAQTAWVFKVPYFIDFRGISDVANKTTYTNKTANIAAHSVGVYTYKFIEKLSTDFNPT